MTHLVLTPVSSRLLAATLLLMVLSQEGRSAPKPLPQLPVIASNAAFTFVVLGDNRGGSDGHQNETFRQVVRAIGPLAPSFVWNTGDMIYGQSQDEREIRTMWQRYGEAIAPLRMPVFHVPGNHDLWDSASARLYEELRGPRYYVFEFAGARFIGLDSETVPGRIDPLQFAWLQRQLREGQPRAIFISVHRPLFPVDGAVGLSLDTVPAERDRLHQLFVEHRGRIRGVFQGHEHLYSFELRDGVPYYITGGAGANLYAAPELGGFHHFLTVRVAAAEASVQLQKVGKPMRPLESPVAVLPGTLLDGWEGGLNWYSWDYTVMAELAAGQASQGRSALRLNFDLAQNAWPVLSLPRVPPERWGRPQAFSVDVFVPADLKPPLTVAAGVEDEVKREAPPVPLRPGWNTIRTELQRVQPALPAGTVPKSLGWTLTSDQPTARGWVFFDNFQVLGRQDPTNGTPALLEGWEGPLLWRALDESVVAEPIRNLQSEGTGAWRVSFDFELYPRPMLAARLNPPWDLTRIDQLRADIYVPDNLGSSIAAQLAIRFRETEHAGPPVPLHPGWNQVRTALDPRWLPAAARAAAEQVQWMLTSTNATLKGWAVFDNFRAANR